jgi:hypothetical protein
LPEVVRRSPTSGSVGSRAVVPPAAAPTGGVRRTAGQFGTVHGAGSADNAADSASSDSTSAGIRGAGIGSDFSASDRTESGRARAGHITADRAGSEGSTPTGAGSAGFLGASPLRRSTEFPGAKLIGARHRPLVPGALDDQQLAYRASGPTSGPVPSLPLGLAPSDRRTGLRRMLSAPDAVSVARRADSIRPAASMAGFVRPSGSQPSGWQQSAVERSPAIQHGRHRQPESASTAPESHPVRPASPFDDEPARLEPTPAAAAPVARQRPTFGLASLARPVRRSVAAADPAAAATRAATTDVAGFGSTARASGPLAARWSLPGAPALDERRLPTLRRRAELVPAAPAGYRPRPMAWAPVTGRSQLPDRVDQHGQRPAASATGDTPILRRTVRAIVPGPALTSPSLQSADSAFRSTGSTFRSADSTFRSAASTFRSAGLTDRSAGSAVRPVPMVGRSENSPTRPAEGLFAPATAAAPGHAVRRKLATGLAALTGGALAAGGFASAHQQDLDVTARHRLGGAIRPTAGVAATGGGMPQTGTADTGRADLVSTRRQAATPQQPLTGARQSSAAAQQPPVVAAQLPRRQPAAQSHAAASAATQRQATSGPAAQARPATHDTSYGAGRPTADRPAQTGGTRGGGVRMPSHPGTVRRMPRRLGSPAAAVRPLPSTHAAAATAQPVAARAAHHDRTPLPGGLLTTMSAHNRQPADNRRSATDRRPDSQASADSRTLTNSQPPGNGQLGAFVRRAVVVAPPRISVRPAELAPGAGGPAVPEVARGQVARTKGTTAQRMSGGSAGHQAGAPAIGREVDGPVIRRSLSGAAHTLFRSLLAGQPAGGTAFAPAGFGRSGTTVSGGNAGMFDDPHAHQPDEPAVIRRFGQPNADPEQHASQLGSDDASPAMRARDFDELIDRIVAKLEHRILEDLERRGRRGIPGVF